MKLLSNNAIVSDKNSLLTAPVQSNRYLVVEDTRELYYDNDNGERFKIRDIQLLAKDSDRFKAKSFSQDLYYVLETNQLWFYNVVEDPENKGTYIGLWNFAHPSSGVEAGTYTKVETDSFGHIVKGSNPTTLEEYNLKTDTEKFIKSFIDNSLSSTSENAVQNKVITEKITSLEDSINNLKVENETLYI